jgi:hypothetical protein
VGVTGNGTSAHHALVDQRRFEVLGVGILFASSGFVVILATRDAAPAWAIGGAGLMLVGFGCALVSLLGLPAAIRGWRPGRDERGRDPGSETGEDGSR